jgi:pimeloyl-ACP methyl ester carboxylesterase
MVTLAVTLAATTLLSACEAPPPADEIAGVAHHVTTVAGVDWHWIEAGEGPALVLLHGLPETWHGWHRLIPALSERRRVIAPDLKGMGSSSGPEGDYSFCAVAEELIGLLDRIGVEQFDLVGHDWGAFVGACAAASHPDRVLSYTHVSAPIDRYDLARRPDLRDFYLAPESVTAFLRDVAFFVTRVYEVGIHDWPRGLDPAVLDRRIADFRSAPPALSRYFRDLDLTADWRLRSGSRAEWERMTVPVTIVAGDRDLMVPQELFLDAQDYVPGFQRVVLIDNAGHFPAEEQPGQLLAVLEEVLER